MPLRWTAAGMMEATKEFRRLKAHKQLLTLRFNLPSQAKQEINPTLEQQNEAA